jgi:hypothetical protein
MKSNWANTELGPVVGFCDHVDEILRPYQQEVSWCDEIFLIVKKILYDLAGFS